MAAASANAAMDVKDTVGLEFEKSFAAESVAVDCVVDVGYVPVDVVEIVASVAVAGAVDVVADAAVVVLLSGSGMVAVTVAVAVAEAEAVDVAVTVAEHKNK